MIGLFSGIIKKWERNINLIGLVLIHLISYIEIAGEYFQWKSLPNIMIKTTRDKIGKMYGIIARQEGGQVLILTNL